MSSATGNLASGDLGTGVLPSQAISAMISDGALSGTPAILADQIQPASLDLRLGSTAFRVRASFLAGEGQSVADVFYVSDEHGNKIRDYDLLKRIQRALYERVLALHARAEVS